MNLRLDGGPALALPATRANEKSPLVSDGRCFEWSRHGTHGQDCGGAIGAHSPSKSEPRGDAALSDADIETIARGVDNKRGAGSRLNPKGALLKNADEPIPRFTVPLHELK